MNKFFIYITLAFVLFAGTAFADSFFYTNATYTAVQSGTPAHSLSTEYLWDLTPLQVRYVDCANGSCTTTQYNADDPRNGNFPSDCGSVAAKAGLTNSTYTCSQNYNLYGWNGDPVGGGGGGDGGLGVYVQPWGYIRSMSTTEIFSGSPAASAPCKAEPSSWSSVPNNSGYPAYHYNECTTTRHAGTAVPVATLTASPTTVVSGSSSALTYSCSNGSTSATINNGVGAVSPASAGTVSVSPTTSTTYTLTCTNANGTGTASATVTVTPSTNGTCGPANGVAVSTAPTPSPGTGPAAIGYEYRYITTQPSAPVNPVTGVQVEGPYAGVANPAEYQACISVGYSRLYDGFETPDPASKGPGSCYEYYNANGSIYTFDGAGQDKTVYYAKPGGTQPGANLCSSGTPSTVSGSGPWTWTCAGSGGGTTASCTAPVQAAPDLQAGVTSDLSGTVNQSVTMTLPITNIGTASTGAPFTDTFFVDNDQNTTNGYIAALSFTSGVPNGFPAGYGESNAQASRSFATAGTYYYRGCADNNASYVGTIAESNEGNNCSGWKTITISNAPAPVPTCSLTANPPTTVPSTLTWSSTNATTCTGGGTGFNTGNAPSGSISVSAAGTYTLTCTGTGGSCSQGVALGSQACTNPTGTLTAAPTRVRTGGSVNLTYAASGITTSCRLQGPNVDQTFPANSCSITGGTTPSGTLATQSTYTLTCDGVERARTIVNVTPIFQNF